MTQPALIMGVVAVLLLTAAHLLFALIKGKAVLAGQFIEKDRSPIAHWLWLAFDIFVLAFCALVLMQLIGEISS